MADWSANVGITQLYTTLLSLLAARDIDAVTLGEIAYTNPPTGAIEYNRAGNKFRRWSGAAYADLLIALAGGGTGAANAADARTNLGLGDMATQSSGAVNITAGTLAGTGAGITNLNAAALATNTVPTARLGSGAASSAVFLRGDQSWAAVPLSTLTVAAVQTADFTAAEETLYPVSGSHTMTLPATAGRSGKRVVIVNRSTGTWTINTTGGELILGATSLTFDWGQYSSITFVADSTSGVWDIV